MRKLALIIYLLTAPTWADTTYSSTTTALALASHADATWAIATTTAQTVTAYSPAVAGSTAVSGTVNVNLYFNDIITINGNVSKAITYRVGKYNGTTQTQICSGTYNTGIVNSFGVTGGGNCTASAVTVNAGETLYLSVTLPALTSANITAGDDITLDINPNTNVVWPQTMFFCPSTGPSTCACNGICNGNTCGTASSVAQSNTCSCDCTATACATTLTIPAPGSFACASNSDGSTATCSWASVTGSSNYQLQRGAGNVYTGGALTYTDAPGIGNWSYSVFASGSCPPASGVGTTLTGKNTATSSSIPVVIQSRSGAIVITGQNDHNPFCRDPSP